MAKFGSQAAVGRRQHLSDDVVNKALGPGRTRQLASLGNRMEAKAHPAINRLTELEGRQTGVKSYRSFQERSGIINRQAGKFGTADARLKAGQKFSPPRRGEFGKAERFYDAHDVRQRRSGQAVAATGIGAGLLAFSAGKGALRSTAKLRKLAGETTASKPGSKGKVPKVTGLSTEGKGAAAALKEKHMAAVRSRDWAKAGGEVVLGGTSGELARRSRNDANRRWK